MFHARVQRILLFYCCFPSRYFLLNMAAAGKPPANDSERLGRCHSKGEPLMRKRSLSLVLTVAGAVAALSACQTPTMEDFNSLRSEVASLQSRVSAAEARGNEAATAANRCQQVCERADRMFQQSTRK